MSESVKAWKPGGDLLSSEPKIEIILDTSMCLVRLFWLSLTNIEHEMKPKREQINQHLPLRVNNTVQLSIMPLLHVLHGETLWYLSLSSLSRGPWSNYICKRQRPRQYIRWLTVTLCKTTEIMSAAVIFFKVWNVVVLKGSIQLPSRVEIKNFACYLDQ